MPKDELVYVGHMYDLTRRAVAKVEGKTRSDFDADENLRLALAKRSVFGGTQRRCACAGC